VRSGFRGDSLLFIEIIDNLQEDAECIHTKHEAWKIYDQRLPYLIDDLKERIHKWKDT
jgi:Iap family predicted aminopeptidase